MRSQKTKTVDTAFWKEHQIKVTLQYQAPNKKRSSTIYKHQRLLKDEKPPTLQVDSIPKTVTRLTYLWIDTKHRIHFVFYFYVFANDISHNNTYTSSLGFSMISEPV